MAHKRPYDHHWAKLRLKVLHRDGYRCYEPGCTKPATTVDHIQPVDEAPHLRLDPHNLRASCTTHNYGRAMRRGAAVLRANQNMGTRRPW